MSSTSTFTGSDGLFYEQTISVEAPLLSLGPRRRAMTSLELSRPLAFSTPLVQDTQDVGHPPSLISRLWPRRSPTRGLQLSIPSNSADSTPQSSESPETPASLGSPITGVVDLTRFVKTISPEPVAQGGLSDIFQGEWELAHRENEAVTTAREAALVAIKLLRVLSVKDQDGVRARKRLNREVYVWHRLEHPNIVKLFGTSYHMGGRPAMVMQWYKNGSATEYLKKNPCVDRMALILDIARGLAYLHTHCPPIIHADLKANNVLITDDGRAVLSDFGLSRVVEDLGGSTGYTLSHPDVGPLRWQAPEFLEDEDTPFQLPSDVWSFGCTAFELLTSNIPYAHRSRDGPVIKDIQNGIKPSGPSGTVLENFDSRVGELLDQCWSFCPDKRPHMTEVISQLEAICDGRFSLA